MCPVPRHSPSHCLYFQACFFSCLACGSSLAHPLRSFTPGSLLPGVLVYLQWLQVAGWRASRGLDFRCCWVAPGAVPDCRAVYTRFADRGFMGFPGGPSPGCESVLGCGLLGSFLLPATPLSDSGTFYSPLPHSATLRFGERIGPILAKPGQGPAQQGEVLPNHVLGPPHKPLSSHWVRNPPSIPHPCKATSYALLSSAPILISFAALMRF